MDCLFRSPHPEADTGRCRTSPGDGTAGGPGNQRSGPSECQAGVAGGQAGGGSAGAAGAGTGTRRRRDPEGDEGVPQDQGGCT